MQLRIILLSLFSFLSFWAVQSQIKEKTFLDYQLLDTLRQESSTTWYRAIWLNDTIELGLAASTKKLDERLLAYLNSKQLLTKEAEAKVLENQKMFAQNCYSYAFEVYFDNDSTYSQSAFTSRSKTEDKSTETVLKHSFTKIDEFPVRPRRNLKQPLPNHVLVAFVNKSNWISHLAYYNHGILYSKNGMWKPSQYRSLHELLKESYRDTKLIQLYRFKP